jgi:predicted acetyltransferase
MPEVIIRNPSPGEVENAANVAYEVFSGKCDYWQRLFHTIAGLFGERFIVVGEADGRIVSTLVCTPGPVYVGEAEISHSAVGAVCTLADFRQRGIAGQMLAYALKSLRDEGICTSSLWPASYEYYRKFGWEIGGEVRSYSADSEVYAGIGNPDMARGASPADLETIKQVYEFHALNYNCCTKRSDEWWKQIIRIDDFLHLETQSGRGGIVSIDDEGRISGYCIYEVQVGDEAKSVAVKEIVSLEPDSRRNMLARLAAIDPEAKVTFASPVDDSFFHELTNPRQVGATVRATFMFRIIDPEQAIKRLQPFEDVSCHFTLAVDDPVFKHSCEFGVEVDGGRVSTGNPAYGSRIQMDVQTLAKLYSGYYTVIDAWNLGKIQIKGDALQVLADASAIFSSLPPFRSWIEPG